MMFIIWILKLNIWCLRTFTSYSATALPGLILERYFPEVLRLLCAQLETVIMITGTNGKTTTAKMLGHLLSSQDIAYVANRSGSNMIRGVASSLLDHCNWKGRLKVRTAILEVEEATMPRLVKLIRPDIIVVTNIFRDQMDAYGEIDKTLSYIRNSIEIGKPETLILNADDERVASLGKDFFGEVISVGLDEVYKKLVKWENKSTSFGAADYRITNIKVDDTLQSTFDLVGKKEKLTSIRVQTPGVHNCFNAALALIAAKNITHQWLPQNLGSLSPAFGRGEIIKNGNAQFQLLLVKNPAGMNLNLFLLSQISKDLPVLFMLNDNIADGRDVSWIWDCDFSDFKFKNIYCAGTRRFDMALRLEYSGIKSIIFDTTDDAISKLSKLDGRIFVLPTYTAMVEFRKALGKNKMWI